MKNIHITLASLAFVLTFCNNSFSQSAFEEGTNAINLGVGFGSH